MKVCAVIVTYGDRYHFLKKVVNELVSQCIDKIVVVDNGSISASNSALHNLAENNGLISLHRFEHNEGSAIGFKTGIELANQSDCEFLWILDDDNLPDNNALQTLKEFWAIQESRSPVKLLALSSMRKDREIFVNAAKDRKSDGLLWPKNSFLGFHIKSLWAKLAERLSEKKTATELSLMTPMRLDAGFYGGLFFHKSLLTIVGYPDEKMVLYADDFCFTYAITLKKGEIWLVPDSIVADIDMPFYLPVKKGILYHSSLDGKNNAQVYYATRNSLYCTRKFFMTSKAAYLFNKIVFLVIITFTGTIRGKFNRLLLIFRAIRDGEKGLLGKNLHYPLN